VLPFSDFEDYLREFNAQVSDLVADDDLIEHLASQFPQRLNKVNKVLKELFPSSQSDLKALDV
jgi:chromosome segregation ATPase